MKKMDNQTYFFLDSIEEKKKRGEKEVNRVPNNERYVKRRPDYAHS